MHKSSMAHQPKLCKTTESKHDWEVVVYRILSGDHGKLTKIPFPGSIWVTKVSYKTNTYTSKSHQPQYDITHPNSIKVLLFYSP